MSFFRSTSAQPSPPIPGDVSRQLADLDAKVDRVLSRMEQAVVPQQEAETPAGALAPEDGREVDEFLFRQLQLPLIEELIRVVDRLDQVNAAAGQATAEVLRENLQSLSRDLLQVLDAQGVHAVRDCGEYDRSIHRCVEVTETENPDLDERILLRIRRGYVRQDRVVRKAEVTVTQLRRPREVSP